MPDALISLDCKVTGTAGREGITLRISITGSCTTGATANAAHHRLTSASAARWNERAARAQAAINRYANDSIRVMLEGQACLANTCSGMRKNWWFRATGATGGSRAASTSKAIACWLKNA